MSAEVTKAEFAKYLKVAKSRVSALLKRGLPTTPAGEINIEKACAWMRANCEQQSGFPDKGINLISSPPSADGAVNPGEPAEAMSLDDDSAVLPFADAKALRETYLARMARLAYRERAGELLEAEAVEIKWANILGTVRARMLAVPSRYGSRHPHLSPHEIEELDQEIRDGLAELGGGKTNGNA